MAEWLGIEGRHKRTIINTEKIMYITGNAYQEIEIHFENGCVERFNADYERTIKALKKSMEKTDGKD